MSESESKVFKPRPKHLLPIILGLLATGALAYPISLVGAPQAQVTPFVGDTVTSASLNAVVFVFALGASATIMFLLIRRGRMRFIRRLVNRLVDASLTTILPRNRCGDRIDYFRKGTDSPIIRCDCARSSYGSLSRLFYWAGDSSRFGRSAGRLRHCGCV